MWGSGDLPDPSLLMGFPLLSPPTHCPPRSSGPSQAYTTKVLRCRHHLIGPDGGRLSAKLVPAADVLATTCGAHLTTSSAAAGCYLGRQMFDTFMNQLEGPDCIYIYWTTSKSSLHWTVCGMSQNEYTSHY